MKKLLIITTLAALAWSCASEDALKPDSEAKTPNLSLTRTPAEAIVIANQLAKADANSSSRSVRKAVDATSVTVIGSNMSRTSTDTLIYAVDYADNNGFVLISANKATEPILAIIDKGSYDESKYVGNDNFQYFMENAKDYVKSNSVIIDPGRDDYRMLEYVDTVRVYSSSGARVKVNWSQGWPENKYFPNKVAGCGPVAIAQIMSYFKPTFNMELTFSGRPSNNISIDWNELSKHVTSINSKSPSAITINAHLNGCDATEDLHDKLACFTRETWYAWHGTSTDSTSSMQPLYVKWALAEYLAGHRSVYSKPEDFYNNLKSSGVGIVFGWRNEDGIHGGHAWVADGISSITYTITTYYNYCPKTGEYDSKESTEKMDKFIHYNWGWAGNCNGYYLEGVFRPVTSTSIPGILETRSNESTGDYKYNTEAIIYY